ncbi:MAG: DUF1761 domain-containing protein [Spirochaetota bacterium]
MNASFHFNWLPYLVSVAAYFLLGFLWYSFLFGELWAKETGTEMGRSNVTPALPLLGHVVASALYVLGLYLVVKLFGCVSIQDAILVAAGITAFSVLPLNAGTVLFKTKPALFGIDAGYQALGTLIVTVILTLWK